MRMSVRIASKVSAAMQSMAWRPELAVTTLPEGISFEIESPTRLSVVGIDKQLVGEVAARVRSKRKPEPYKGKGVRYVGEVVVQKAGKSFVGGEK